MSWGLIAPFSRSSIYKAILLLLLLTSCLSLKYDCCEAALSSSGVACSTSGTTYDNTTYYCVSISLICPSCKISSDSGLSSASCYQCCVTDPDACGTAVSLISTSSWILIFMIFAGSCCCCSIVFLSAEHSRLKEGLTFREAYLIPIPLVVAEIDSGDKDYLFPPDQPTAIARAHTSIDIPVAEPTENSSLVSRYVPERSILWD